jgi:murein DD-endopeptidase MepM/ murein hydrolase activator NlpD
MGRWFSTGALFGLAVAGLHAQAGSPRDLTLRAAVVARAINPGEALRLDIQATGLPSTVTVDAFGKIWPAAPMGEGRFLALVGIDLDAAAGLETLTVTARAGEAVVSHDEQVVVEAKAFPTRNLTVAPRFVNPPASARARIAREQRQLGALFRSVSPAPLWHGAFRRPIESTVVSGFGVRSIYNGEPRAPHGGADFSSPTGTPIAAPGGGRVVLAGSLYYTGDTVVVDHGLGLVSLFAHLSRIDVKVGDVVTAGDRIGLVGATGRVTGPHLHWTVRLNGARVDPLSVVAVLDEM